ncbi:MAG: hypothetical protein ISS10_01865 [Candidatus Marinimicrobia bacterium]|nr:hypothetical protein [Candidatus Neomarinimicrobiota bacterium]MBL7059726.1 hypothetical protein [Candidatus Neomarinimicrobiota bacterium]
MKFIRSGLSFLLTLWLSAFSVFSTAHIGHTHHFGAKPDIGFCSVDCADANHHHDRMDCIWAVAQMSTVGEISVTETFTLNHINSEYYSETEPFTSILVTDRNSRAPPQNLL